MTITWTKAETGWVLGCHLGKVELRLFHLTREDKRWLITTADGYWPNIQGYHHEGTLAECLDWARDALQAHGLHDLTHNF